MKYIDTHGHLNSEEFMDDVKSFITQANEAGVEKIIIPGTTKEDSLQAMEIAEAHDNVFAMIATHPIYGQTLEDTDWLETIDGSKLVGVGETGIDLYRESSPSVEIQQENFRKHIRFAMKWDLPVIVHTRDAEQDTLDVMNESEFKDVQFVIHSSTMKKEWVMKFVEQGAYISFSGIVTFKNARDVKEAMWAVPLNRLLTETDSPYLAPVPVRGKTNKPENVKYTAEFIADSRPEENQEILEQIYKNAHDVFSI